MLCFFLILFKHQGKAGSWSFQKLWKKPTKQKKTSWYFEHYSSLPGRTMYPGLAYFLFLVLFWSVANWAHTERQSKPVFIFSSKCQSKGMPQERKNPFDAFIEDPWVKNSWRLRGNSQRSLSSHTADLTPGFVWVMRSVGLWESDWIRGGNSSWWGWGSCSHMEWWNGGTLEALLQFRSRIFPFYKR